MVMTYEEAIEKFPDFAEYSIHELSILSIGIMIGAGNLKEASIAVKTITLHMEEALHEI